MRKKFQNPSNEFRPIPFWSWNGLLKPEEIKEQIHELKESGVGGYFMHARSGLQTDYLSEDWFRCIETGISMAKKEELDAWIYDEEGWPSGFAGGIVPAASKDYQSKYMTMEHYKSMDQIERADLIALYRYHTVFCRYVRVGLTETCINDPEEEFLAIRKHTNPFYVDTLSKRAIDTFISSTHDAYYEKFGKEFGVHMHGFFTDEPRLACNHFGELAWSDEIPGAFLKKYGYDIMDHIPALYLKTDQCRKYRYDFWSLVNEMFVENYMKNLYDWCEIHNCKITGHIMMEESIFSQMTSTAGVMPFYEYMHIPGIDWLRRMIASPVIGKQVGSVACQLGKKQVLTESFALCGWNVSFEELKWIAEWQFVNGVNQICQHLMAYTIKGSRKRDYPPSHFVQQTWWKESKLFHDYLGRLCVALSEGDQTADVLLIHPMKSGYVAYDGTRTEEIRLLDDEFVKISERLSGEHISYHFGDETIIRKYANVDHGLFIVGKISYRTVILPHMYTMEEKTVELLIQFLSEGGQILSTGRFPDYTNGSMELLKSLEKQVTRVEPSKIRSTLTAQYLVALSIAEESREISHISYLQRECEQGTILFLVNHDQKASYGAQVKVFGKQSRVMILEAETGEIRPISYEILGDDTAFSLHFEPMGSYLLLLEPTKERSLQLEIPKIQEVKMKKEWEIESMDLNSMTLDYCTYRIDGGEIQGPIPVIRLQDILLSLRRPCSVELGFTFDVTMDLNKNREFYVVIEDAHLYTLKVNGTVVSTRDSGWWKDKSFCKIDIKNYLKNGTNTLILNTEFSQSQKVYDVLFGDEVYETEKNKLTYDIEIDSIYLLGDFGVVSKSPFHKRERNAMVTDGPFTITDAPLRFISHDFTTNGLLFFAGTIKLNQKLFIEKEEGKRVILDLGGQNAPFIKIYVNNILVKNSLWAPYTADITEVIQEGENTISVQLFASNRNLFGPHHHIDGECYQVGPESFTGKWSWVERSSEAEATDIADRTKNYWTDTYSFVEFGFPQMRSYERTIRQYKDKKYEETEVKALLHHEISQNPLKIVVLDDDPTGTQTIHDLNVYTDWSFESILEGFREENLMFYILTNSRAMTSEQTAAVHCEITGHICRASMETGKPFLIIIRGDSTLRGHYPLETQVVRNTLEQSGEAVPDGEILIPFFQAGGRYTVDNIHYVRYWDDLVPAGETEFAKDKTFGYTKSDMREYIEEKTEGSCNASSVCVVSLESLRNAEYELITDQLMQAKDYGKIIVNALEPMDLEVFCVSLYRAWNKGKRFLFRTAADFVKAVGGIGDRELLSMRELVNQENSNGGIVVVGSHTAKTTKQLEKVMEMKNLDLLEFNSDLVLEDCLDGEVLRVVSESEKRILQGRTVVIYTKRTLLTVEGDTKERALLRSVKISDAVQRLVGELGICPAFVVAKGGITSSDIGVKALGVKKARVLGQIIPGVPVWKTEKESRFPEIPYVIFPGNVGNEEALKQVIETLTGVGRGGKE